MENELIKLPTVDFETGKIEITNESALTKAVDSIKTKYTGLVFTGENIKDARNARIELGHSIKALDDARKQVKKEYLIPLNEFEAKIKTLTSQLSEQKDNIHYREKQYNDKLKQAKLDEIKAYIADMCATRSIKPSEVNIDSRWLNKSTTRPQWKRAVNHAIELAEVDHQRQQAEIELITQSADTNRVDASPYIELYDRGTSAVEVIQSIARDAQFKRQREQAERDSHRVIGDKSVDVETGEIEELKGYTLEFKATEKQYQQIKGFMKKIGVKNNEI
jgi:hypothetical protein